MTAVAEPDDAVPLAGEIPAPDFFGHPRGLWYLAFTEAWERFSYYGMQSLLVLYMVKYLLLPGRIEHVAAFDSFRRLYGGLDGQALASAIFGTYTATVYLTPIFGGFLADRVLGRRRTVLLGALTMAAGHFLMAFEGAFLFALLCLVLGCGMFKGNIASQVGSLYKPEDLRRADAFQIFYLGINAGVIASPLIVGTLGEVYGWHYGFAAAGVGMLLATGIYLSGQKYLRSGENEARAIAAAPPARNSPGATGAPSSRSSSSSRCSRSRSCLTIRSSTPISSGATSSSTSSSWARSCPPPGSSRLTRSSASASSRSSRSFTAGMGSTGANPTKSPRSSSAPASPVAGMMCLVIAAATRVAGHKIGLFWPVAFHIVNSIAFAHLLPISLALFAKYAPKAINATIIGLYYLAFFFANTLVGWVGGFYETMTTTNFWLLHAGFAAGAGLCFVIFKFVAGHYLEVEPERAR